MNSVLLANFDLCSGCGICQLVCSARITGSYNPRLACLKVVMEMEGLLHRPTVCKQCQNAFCEKICTFNAIKRDVRTGALVINNGACTGCGKCVDLCPEKVIYINSSKKAVKCDFCAGEPLCLKYCPTGALQLVQTWGVVK